MGSNSRLSILRSRNDFLHILKSGQRVRATDWLLLNFVVRESGSLRCGWTLPRQVGSAVVRNKLKRWSRMYFRNRVRSSDSLPPIDLNLVFRKPQNPEFYKRLNYEEFSIVLDKAWQQVEKRSAPQASSANRSRPRPRES